MGKPQENPADMIVNSLLSNALLARRALLDKAMDGTDRNINFDCKYPDNLTAADYRDIYDREGIARRVVHCLPEESWCMDPEIYNDENPDIETEFESAIKTLNEKHNLFHFLLRADVLSGIGQFGVILLGINDGKPLSEPADGISNTGERVGKHKYELLYIRVFDESVTSIVQWETDITNPRYGKPVKYSIRFQDNTGSGDNFTQEVHWTRIIHIADNRNMSEIYGVPRMQSVYNRLFDLRKILSGSGEMFWRGAFPGYAFEVNPDVAEGGADMDVTAIRQEFLNYSNGLQRFLALVGVTAKSLPVQVVDPTGHVEAHLKSIAISLGIPFRILFGSEQAQLASSQDARAWNRRVSGRQEKYLNPMVIRPVIDRLLALGILPDTEKYYIYWPDMNTLSDEEKANVGVTRTDALVKYVSGGVDAIIPPSLYMHLILGMSIETVMEITRAAEDYLKESEENQRIKDESRDDDQNRDSKK